MVYADTLFIADPWIWIILILGLELSWRAERLNDDWRRPAAWALTAMSLYIGLNDAISARSVALTRPLVERVASPKLIVAGEVPLEFWKRQMLWRGDSIGGAGEYDLLKGLNSARLDPQIVALRLDDPTPCRCSTSQSACARLSVLVAHAARRRSKRQSLSYRPAVLPGVPADPRQQLLRAAHNSRVNS